MSTIGNFVQSLASATPTAASGLERTQAVVMDLVLGRGFTPTSAQPAAPVAPPPTLPAAADFRDLRIPEDILAVVEPVLAQFGIRVEVTCKEHLLLHDTAMHFATDGNFEAYLLHFDARILADPLQARDVLTVAFLFGRGDTLRVLSRGGNDPDPAFDFTWGSWGDQGLAVEYVQWRDIERLAHLEAEKRADFLRLKFRLPATVKRRAAPSQARLLDDPRYFKELVDLIAANGNATGSGVSAFINGQLIGVLPEDLRTERAEWGHSYVTAARELLQWTESKGNHPTRAGFTCTGAVLETFLDGQGKDGRVLIVTALQRFHLITDAKALAALTTRYLDQAQP